MTTLARSLSKTKIIFLAFPEINWKRFYTVCIFLTIALLFLSLAFYVFGVNELTKGSYTIKGYEKEIKILSEENAKLEMKFAEVGFLGDIQQRASQMDFERIKAIKYIQIVAGELARAK